MAVAKWHGITYILWVRRGRSVEMFIALRWVRGRKKIDNRLIQQEYEYRNIYLC